MAVHKACYSATELTQQDGPHRRETFQVRELAAKSVDHTEQAFNFFFDAAKAPLPPSASDPYALFQRYVVAELAYARRLAFAENVRETTQRTLHSCERKSKSRAILIRISSARKLSSSMDTLVVENANAPRRLRFIRRFECPACPVRSHIGNKVVSSISIGRPRYVSLSSKI
jgi:hypothetical protein